MGWNFYFVWWLVNVIKVWSTMRILALKSWNWCIQHLVKTNYFNPCNSLDLLSLFQSYLYGSCLYFKLIFVALASISVLFICSKLQWKISIKYIYRRKCTFNPYILHLFHFGPYIFISPLLVPKSINAFHFGPYRYLFNRNCWYGKRSVLLAH